MSEAEALQPCGKGEGRFWTELLEPVCTRQPGPSFPNARLPFAYGPSVPSCHYSPDRDQSLTVARRRPPRLSPPPSHSCSGHTSFLSVPGAHNMFFCPRAFARAIPFFPCLVKPSSSSPLPSVGAPVLAGSYSGLCGICDSHLCLLAASRLRDRA